jgi:hypothetical protein
MKKLSIINLFAFTLIMAFLGMPELWAQTTVPYVEVTPGVAFTVGSTAPTTGVPEGYEWNKFPSAGAWTTFPGATLTVQDTLATEGQSARYRVRAFDNRSYACDENGCTSFRRYGVWSDPSDWMIATVPTPAPGACGKPGKK